MMYTSKLRELESMAFSKFGTFGDPEVSLVIGFNEDRMLNNYQFVIVFKCMSTEDKQSYMGTHTLRGGAVIDIDKAFELIKKELMDFNEMRF